MHLADTLWETNWIIRLQTEMDELPERLIHDPWRKNGLCSTGKKTILTNCEKQGTLLQSVKLRIDAWDEGTIDLTLMKDLLSSMLRNNYTKSTHKLNLEANSLTSRQFVSSLHRPQRLLQILNQSSLSSDADRKGAPTPRDAYRFPLCLAKSPWVVVRSAKPRTRPLQRLRIPETTSRSRNLPAASRVPRSKLNIEPNHAAASPAARAVDGFSDPGRPTSSLRLRRQDSATARPFSSCASSAAAAS